MTTTAIGARGAVSAKDTATASADWRAAALAMLSIRIIQGFVYWGGGSRRFIYAPSKLDPSAPSWMANKLQSAMPGALLGTDHVVAYLMGHFWLLYASIVVFSAVELVVGLALMAGFMTRLAALASLGLSVSLMLLFGWQGGTCIDEWTMASCNVAIAATLMLAGSAAFSLDGWLLRRNPSLARQTWFRWCGGALPGCRSANGYRRLAFALIAFVLVFDLGLYNYYRGSILTPYHKGPVGAEAHAYGLADATRLADGGVRFTIALDGGTPAVPGHVMAVEILDAAATPSPIGTGGRWPRCRRPRSPTPSPTTASRPGLSGSRAAWARKPSSLCPRRRAACRRTDRLCASPTSTDRRSALD